MRKIAIAATALLIWAVVGAIGVYAAQRSSFATGDIGVRVAGQSVAEIQGELQISGDRPELSGFANTALQAEINSLIRQEIDDKIEAAKSDRARSINFEFEHELDRGLHSIIIRTSTQTLSVRVDVRTFVFGSGERLMALNNILIPGDRLLTVNDVLGPNGVKIINQVIEHDMARQPGTYNANFSGITEEQSFYVKNGMVNVIFNKFAIGPASLDTPRFPINIDRVHRNTFILSHSDTYNNVRMIPLRIVAEELGFVISPWDRDMHEQTVTITRRDSRDAITASLKIGSNTYFRNRQPIMLEQAPELKDGITYLPISFFERILDVCYTIDQAGRITFSYYNSALTPRG